MSINEDILTKLKVIIRKPQEGKTFICIEDITKSFNSLNIIFTMNTIKSNNQFLSRIINKFSNDSVIVFNSSKELLNISCLHCRSIIDINTVLNNNDIKIIILCSHYKRINTDIPMLVDFLSDKKSFLDSGKNIRIHLDEAHKYCSPKNNRESIRKLKYQEIIDEIIMYSATPIKIWNDNDNDFQNIFVVNVEESYNIINNGKYFGVKDTNCITNINNLKYEQLYKIPIKIPTKILDFCPDTKNLMWYKDNYPFSLGNEYEYLSYIGYILNKLKETNIINNNLFNYNFIPGYIRKVTHYMISYLIFSIFPNSLVIIYNGDKTNSGLCLLNNNCIEIIPHTNMLEPCEQINEYIKIYPDKPVFITGFHCVNMSVTLINEDTGNFDNVIMGHPQFLNEPDILYQMCRYVFNYTNWDDISKIKKTKIYEMVPKCFNSNIDYEKQIDHINKTMSGSIRDINEIRGNIPAKKKKILKETIYSLIDLKYIHYFPKKFKKFKVYGDINENNIWSNVKKYFKDFSGIDCKEKSIPKKKNGFYECSTSDRLRVHTNDELKRKFLNWKWYSNFAITNKYKYIRIYVGYDDLEDDSEYTIVIRTLELEKCPKIKSILK